MACPLYIAVLMGLLVMSTVCTAQLVNIYPLRLLSNTEYGYGSGATCFVNEPSSSFESVQWKRNNTTLSVDGELTEAAPARYQVYFYPIMVSLYLNNPVKQDEGSYTCCGTLNTPEGTQNFCKSVFVSINLYLPPLDYPKCSIEPGNTVTMGSYVTFICVPGESYPPVNLELILQREDGPSIQLDIANSTRVVSIVNNTRVVTIEDNNAMFICHMTGDSYIFPPAYRNCTAGPLIVISSSPQPMTTKAPPASPPLTTTLGPSPLTTKSPPAPPPLATTPESSPLTTTPTSLTVTTTRMSSATEPTSITMPMSSTPKDCPDPKDAGSPQGLSITMVIIPTIIAVVAIVADVVLIWKLLEQKKINASLRRNLEKSKDKGVDGPYMELEKTQAATQEYTDLKFEVYEDVDKVRPGVAHQSQDAMYVNVKK